MGMKAQMIVKNQTNSRINTTISDVTCVYHVEPKFNNLVLDPYKSSSSVEIEADNDPIEPFLDPCSLKQKHFQINYLNGSLGIDIGAVAFRTAVTLNSNPAQIQAVLAPNQSVLVPPVPSSFNFYLYGGPGVIAPLVNSVISANLGALTKAISQYLSQHPLEGGIVIDSVNFNAFSCPYAAAVPAGPNLDFSAILKMSATASGNLGQLLSVTDLILLIEGTVDLSSAKPKISVTVFKCSLFSYDISPLVSAAIIALLTAFFLPIVGPIVTAALAAALVAATTPNALAGIINDGIPGVDVNKKILDYINAKLGKL